MKIFYIILPLALLLMSTARAGAPDLCLEPVYRSHTQEIKGNYAEFDIEVGGNTPVEQSSFHDCRLLGLAECPDIEVHIVESNEAPGGVGEPGTPPIAPALANAVFAATGQRLRRLPLEVG